MSRRENVDKSREDSGFVSQSPSVISTKFAPPQSIAPPQPNANTLPKLSRSPSPNGLGGGFSSEQMGPATFAPSQFDAGAGVRFRPTGPEKGVIWLDAVKKRDNYGMAFNRHAEVIELAGGLLLQEPVSEPIKETLPGAMEGLVLYNDRGLAMTWEMYRERWKVLAKAENGTEMLVCDSIRLNGANGADGVDGVDGAKGATRKITTQLKEALKTPLENLEIVDLLSSNTLQKTLAQMVKIVEGLYTMKSRPIGDITEPVFVSLGGMLYTVRGLKRLTLRMQAELGTIEMELKRLKGGVCSPTGLTVKKVLEKTCLVRPMASLLDTVLVYRYTSHQLPYDQKTMDRMTEQYESGFRSFLQEVRSVFPGLSNK